ncbi:MAG TPA: hypothetical protein VIO94_15340 [Phenylobacterium sp.]
MKLVIAPYNGVGPLTFGMSQEEVVEAMGPPQRITKARSGNPILWYDDLNAILEDQRLVEIGLAPVAPAVIHGIQPFLDPDALDKLCKLDGDAREVLGSIVLRNLGVSLGGFHDGDESQKGITAFVRGRWDVLEPEMKQFPGL